MPDNDLEEAWERFRRNNTMLLELLSMRINAALEAEEITRKEGIEIRDPKREAAELARLVASGKRLNPPLDEEAVTAIFQSILDQSARLSKAQRRAASTEEAATYG